MNSETEKYLSELERLANKATPAPWYKCDNKICDRGPWHECKEGDCKRYATVVHTEQDAHFIAAAREAIPRLVKMIRDLDKETYFLADKAGDYGRCPKETSCINDVCTPEHRTYCWQMAAKTWRETDD